MTKQTKETPISIIKLVEGNHARRNPTGTGQYNQREIDEVYDYLQENPMQDVGIISPFRIQVNKYQEKFVDYPAIEIDTVHKFQGRQKDNIILSTVVNDIEKSDTNERFIDFINNPKLFNVALSRAKSHVALVVTHNLYHSKNNNFSDFIKYAEYNADHTKILQGKVTSVFDTLYKEYTSILKRLLDTKKTNIVPTELIIYELLKEILVDYPQLSLSMHTSLNSIIKSYDFFNKEEMKYLTNNLTHIDFLIYNSLTKENILAIEVDGVKYHEQNEKQTLRDGIKDKALIQNGIDIMRLKTNNSKEKERIMEKLSRLTNTN
jgi:hypothetical protein